jgi:hypothetical protein
VKLAMTGGMYKPQLREHVRTPVVRGKHMVHVELFTRVKRLVTDRTAPLLPYGEGPLAPHQSVGTTPPLSPVVLESGIVRGIRLGDEPMSHHACPGKVPARGLLSLILQDPSGLSAPDGPAPILLRSPPTRLARMAPFHVARRALIHEVVQVCKDPFGHPAAEVLAPAPDPGFRALLRATVGEPTCLRQRALRVRRIGWMASRLGVIRSLAPRRELWGAG